MTTINNEVVPDKKGLVGCSGDKSHRQTSIITYLQPHNTEKPEKLEKQENLQKSSTFSTMPIDLEIKSKKTKLTQSVITKFIHSQASSTDSPPRLEITPPTTKALPMAETPTKPMFTHISLRNSSITPINLLHHYPLPLPPTTMKGPTRAAVISSSITKQSNITSYFRPKGITGQHVPKSVRHKPPCMLNIQPKYPSSIQQNHAQPNTDTYHLPPQLTVSSAEDPLVGLHPPPQHSVPPSAVLDAQQTERLPSTPTFPDTNDTPTTNAPSWTSPLQQQPAPPIHEYAMPQLSHQIEDLIPNCPSYQNTETVTPNNNEDRTPLSTTGFTPIVPMNNDDTLYNAPGQCTNQSQPITLGQLNTAQTPPTMNRKKGGHKRILLQYNIPISQPRLSYYQSAALSVDLHDSWGHSMETIDSSSTFRVFLQNPNGLNISHANYSLLHDLDTCQKYGAAVIALPETNTNWSSREHVGMFNGMLKRTWDNVTTSTSRAVEPFLSSYQPGGTATIVCNNWTSRIIGRGEDPLGLGRWSYVTLRGRGTTQVVVITAYNVSQRYEMERGERTAYKQQHRILSHTIRENNLNIAPHPRRQFILDLQSWIEHLIQNNHDVILALDANEPYNPDIPSTAKPLQYTQGNHTLDKGHDGKLSTLIATCGLCDPLARQHPDRPFPASYFRGKNRIDYILVTPRLQNAVLRTGSLPLYSLFQGDHRPYYVDFDAAIAFADNAYEISRPRGRGLQLKDPRVVAKYVETLNDQLSYHNLKEKVYTLQEAAEDLHWTATLTDEYQNTDTLITEAMLYAERKAGRTYSTKFDWSPALTQAVQEFRFWKFKLKLHKGLHVSLTVLQHYQEAAALSDAHLSSTFSESFIINEIRNAYQKMKTSQKDHRKLRASYLEQLAEAIVLHQSPTLDTNEATPIRIERVRKQVLQLKKREKHKHMYKKIGTTLDPNVSLGLNRIDIPDIRARGPNLGSPEDPKTWKGPWVTITNPEEIAKRVCAINIQQYHQASATPFGSGPLADIIGRNGDTQAAKDLLNGTLPSDILSSLLPETIRILKTLATPQPTLQEHTRVSITEEEFVATYKATRETTSSSPSGRHVGHYKAAVKDPTLVSLHTSMMSIPFQAGFAPARWTQVSDIMLEKDPGHARCHRLRILALFESDFNQSKRILIARKLGHHLEDNTMVPGMQYGSRPGRNCHSAVLQKVLSHDIVRLTRTTAAFLENDAIGCYDRLMNNLLLLILVKVGLPTTLAQSMGSIWENTIHHIKTVYGTSKATYTSTPQVPLFGPGQGSTCGPLFWLLCFCLIVDSIDPELSAAVFASVCMSVLVRTVGTAFVDDSSLSVTSNYIRNPDLSLSQNDEIDNSVTIQELSTLAQHWERLLFSTGGAINMQKSFWYLMAWVWKNGEPNLAATTKVPGIMNLTSGTSTVLHTVPRVDVKDSFRTLGIHLSPSGSQKKQVQILRQHANEYFTNIAPSTLTPEEAHCSYMQYLRPRLIYPLPCSSVTQQQCRHIQAPALAALLPKLHLNRHTSHAVIFGELRYGGLGFPDLYTDQGYGQLKLLVGHLKLKDDIGDLILIAISHLQLHTGSGDPFFSLPYPHFSRWIDQNWLTSIWKHTHQIHIKVEVEKHWIPTLAREHDNFLMEIFQAHNFSPSQLRQLNHCRLFLQVITISDIATADGKRILPSALQGIRASDRSSSLQWPRQESPPKPVWDLWRLALSHFSTQSRLNQSLGRWVNKPHQTWVWYMDLPTKIVYRLLPDATWVAYSAVTSPSTQTRSTRQTRTWYNDDTYSPASPEGLSLFPATVYHDTHHKAFFHSVASITPFPLDSPSTPGSSVWTLNSTQHAFVDTPEFYQRLIGNDPPIEDTVGFQIATGLELETLIACSDGSYDPKHQTGSHGWIFASTDKNILAQGAGPADGHPALMSSYRTELGGLLAVLYTIYRICQHYQVTSGKMSYYCDNKGVISNVFSHCAPSISHYFHTDADLVMEARHLLTLLPVTILAGWVKGHYVGDHREYKHDLNDQVDQLADRFNKHPDPAFAPKRMPCTIPGYAIRLIYDNSLLTTKIYKTMASELHRKNIVAYIIKKCKWSVTTFHQVHWNAHELAFSRLSRPNQVMVAKLQHNLVNTNTQNARYYGKSSLCPCCLSTEETLSHVFSCTSDGATAHRLKAITTLQNELASLNTPLSVTKAIIHGISMWVRQQTEEELCIHAPTVGSLRAPDVLLTAAFTEQSQSISWYQFLLGRLSSRWGTAVAAYTKSTDHSYPQKWTAQVISSVWKFSRSLWSYRNTIVHGATDQEVAAKIRGTLDDQARSLYNTFHTSSHFILPRHHYLFTSRSLEQRLRLDFDSLSCWIRSVEDAQQALLHHNNQQRINASRFFAPFYIAGQIRQPNNQDSSDSDFSIPTIDETDTDFTSLAPTELTSTSSSTIASLSTSSSQQSARSVTSASSDAPPSIISWSTSQSSR